MSGIETELRRDLAGTSRALTEALARLETLSASQRALRIKEGEYRSLLVQCFQTFAGNGSETPGRMVAQIKTFLES